MTFRQKIQAALYALHKSPPGKLTAANRNFRLNPLPAESGWIVLRIPGQCNPLFMMQLEDEIPQNGKGSNDPQEGSGYQCFPGTGNIKHGNDDR